MKELEDFLVKILLEVKEKDIYYFCRSRIKF